MDKAEMPTSQEAKQAMESVRRLSAAGLERGLYPRWFAAATALWAGAIAALIGLESPVWILIFVTGLIAYPLYRRRRGAWVQEVHNRRELLTVVVFSAFVCAVAAGGYAGRQFFGLSWAPVVAGVLIAGGLFTLMEVTYRPVRTRIGEEHES